MQHNQNINQAHQLASAHTCACYATVDAATGFCICKTPNRSQHGSLKCVTNRKAASATETNTESTIEARVWSELLSAGLEGWSILFSVVRKRVPHVDKRLPFLPHSIRLMVAFRKRLTVCGPQLGRMQWSGYNLYSDQSMSEAIGFSWYLRLGMEIWLIHCPLRIRTLSAFWFVTLSGRYRQLFLTAICL